MKHWLGKNSLGTWAEQEQQSKIRTKSGGNMSKVYYVDK